MERFLHVGRPAVAAVYAPIIYPGCPVLGFRVHPGQAPQLALTGACHLFVFCAPVYKIRWSRRAASCSVCALAGAHVRARATRRSTLALSV